MLPENMFLNLIDLDLQQKIAVSDDLDGSAVEVLKLLLEKAPTSMMAGLDDLKVEESNGRNILFYKNKKYIPRNMELQQEIVKLFHDHETAGHPGELGTYNVIRQHYWWPGMCTYVKNYVQGCGVCQQFKIDRSPAQPAYMPTEGAGKTRPFAYCSMDLITDLPMADGFDSILVMVDQAFRRG
jgi:hypothetical protein